MPRLNGFELYSRWVPLPNENFPLLSPLISGDTLQPMKFSFILRIRWTGKIQSDIEFDDRMQTSNASSFTCLCLLNLKIMLIYEEPLLSGQHPLSDHLPSSRAWPPNGGLTFGSTSYMCANHLSLHWGSHFLVYLSSVM